VINNFGSSVCAYTINASSGTLTQVGGSPFATGSSLPYDIGIDATGKFLYVANYGNANVSGYTINSSTGALSAVRGSPFTAGASPRGVAVVKVTVP
jgi:6-phosphogluconolactonase (cycloisomerase 2 family)